MRFAGTRIRELNAPWIPCCSHYWLDSQRPEDRKDLSRPSRRGTRGSAPEETEHPPASGGAGPPPPGPGRAGPVRICHRGFLTGRPAGRGFTGFVRTGVPTARTPVCGAQRRIVAAFLRHWAAAAADAVHSITLVVSELLSNAVRYGRAEAGLSLAHDSLSGKVRVEVDDRTPGTRAEPRRPDVDRESGRGLFLVDALTEAWGVRTAPLPGARSTWVLETAGDDHPCPGGHGLQDVQRPVFTVADGSTTTGRPSPGPLAGDVLAHARHLLRSRRLRSAAHPRRPSAASPRSVHMNFTTSRPGCRVTPRLTRPPRKE
ncbi:ATP-binding protein [Streptomyces sp. NPDC088341]|uniref:ATP-binding protein n=1 Tax=Streptomyces sp. NPDC088341 TaxID=3154870 RepID=UPI003448C7A4